MSRITGPTAYKGVRATNPPAVEIASVAPPANATDYQISDIWWNRVTGFFYMYAGIVGGVAQWIFIGGSTGTVLPVALGGTGNSTLTAHAVLIGEGTAPINGVLGATGQVLMGVTGADPAFTGSPSFTGSVTAATTITATLGNITATNGNLALNAAGNKLVIHASTPLSDSTGTTLAMTGTPGAITVSTTACTTSSIIIYSRKITGGTPGEVSITAQSAGSFTLTSTGNETSTFNYLIIN